MDCEIPVSQFLIVYVSVMQSEGETVMSLNLRGKDCSGDLLAGEKIPEGVEEI